MQIIDIHCHVIPELDDGAQSMDMAERMLEMAYEQGVGAVIATAHSSRRFRTEPEEIRRRCAEVEAQIQRRKAQNFRVYPGQEVFFREDMFRELENGTIMTLADSRYVLVEFMPDTPYSVIYGAARRFALSGYRMIMAHIERYECLRNAENIDELRKMGIYFQINVHSLMGKWYNRTSRWCKKMLSEQQIHFIASDMHNTDSRRPRFDAAKQWMENHLEKEYIEDISWRNAWRLINNQKI